MPELPEVETMRRGIAGVVGSRVRSVERARCRLKPILISPRIDAFRRRTVGREVLEVGRLGKRVSLRLAGGESLVFEPRMTGLVLIADPPNIEHLRFRMSFSGGPITELWYWDRRGLGSVRLFSDEELAEHFGDSKLGPDALAVTADELRAHFRGSRRAIKVALLDQRGIAGIGNLYASEILHVAAIHPERPCENMNRSQWVRVHAAIVQVLTEAVRYEGSTLADGTYRNALNVQGGYQHHHRVYNRAGERCSRCSGVVRRFVQAQRSTFFCPKCQRKR